MTKRYKFSRYALYNAIEAFMEKEKRHGKVLAVGETLKGIGKKSAILEMYNDEDTEFICPDYPEVDIQSMPYDDNTFDYVVADQVLEHVRKPWVAVEEIRRVLKPNGYMVLTTCLMMHVHGVPEDYFRFTPDGLRSLSEEFSEIITAGGQGSEKLINSLHTNRGIDVKKNPKYEKLALENDGKNFLHVWIIAKK